MAAMIEHEIRPKVFYVHNEVHRNGAPGKGQWGISEANERMVFTHAYDLKWVDDVVGWGLAVADGKATYLGVDKFGAETFLAMFIDKNATKRWHGFPASPLEVPLPSVLNAWLTSGVLRKKAVKNLSRGESCSL